MIRRQTNETFQLITQHDHALLAGKLAEHIGNSHFATLIPRHETITAIGLHDAGWPEWEQELTLNPAGLPSHVFETLLPAALSAWKNSADRAEAINDYTGLLVSLHSLNLSIIPASKKRDSVELFELNKFQHREIERQVRLRTRLGMRNDVPMWYGLPQPGTPLTPIEEQLIYNFRILQTMDQLSLELCCTEELFPRIPAIPTRPAGPAISFHLSWSPSNELLLTPWPFDQDQLQLQVPYRSIPAKSYPSESDLRQTYAQAPTESLTVKLRKQ